ncbi:MAG: hypothetical protein AB1726_08915 [Planctomycetota bacterium]
MIGVPVAVLVAAGATPVLALLARRIGWTDAAEGALAARKRQARPVPPVGGAALLLGIAAALAVEPAAAGRFFLLADAGAGELAGAGISLVLLFAVGLLDDLRPGGWRPGPKLLLQAAALLPLAAVAGGRGGGAAGVAVLLGGLGAVNAANTFDVADGALGGVLFVGLLPASPLLAGALAGFLPWNLNARAARARPGEAGPTAYLGDAGSHLLGGLVLLHPPAWPALLLPLLDLARLSVVRARAGSRPWIGDRRHLAHRLAARGLSARALALALSAAALPATAAGWAAAAGGALLAPAALGAALTAFLFLALLRVSRPAAGPGRP